MRPAAMQVTETAPTNAKMAQATNFQSKSRAKSGSVLLRLFRAWCDEKRPNGLRQAYGFAGEYDEGTKLGIEDHHIAKTGPLQRAVNPNYSIFRAYEKMASVQKMALFFSHGDGPVFGPCGHTEKRR